MKLNVVYKKDIHWNTFINIYDCVFSFLFACYIPNYIKPHSRKSTVNECTFTLFFVCRVMIIKNRFLISKRITMWKDFAEPKSNRIIQPLNSFSTFQKEWNWSEVIDYINFLIGKFGFLLCFWHDSFKLEYNSYINWVILW